MSDKVFLDTNILVYCSDENDIQKQKKAREIVESLLKTHSGVISTQVLQEFYNVSTKKLKTEKSLAMKDVEDYSVAFPVHNNTPKDILSAISISISTQYTIYDSLIIAAAKAEGCDVVYSEDLNDGQVVEGVKIENPLK
ncbi:MAG: PIN domain-containing protein [Treponema sp.]|uniref:PIN domain-containing protein n=1 Tax=Treponema sp. TaxID=166 RepID=UPI0025FB6780|nr:PIN domain-containing protein [Treponema sp.]MBQ8681202.1 PIN domain-containing protein [Treponema sp.]MBR1403104.1 PIN domain-containing protein [Treponema sp.]